MSVKNQMIGVLMKKVKKRLVLVIASVTNDLKLTNIQILKIVPMENV